MGLFENQIDERRRADQQLLEDSFADVVGVVLGRRSGEAFNDNRIITNNAIDDILKYYHYKPVEIPERITNNEERLDYCLSYYGIMRRNVVLEKGWYRDAFGAILAFTKEDQAPVVLRPGKLKGYVYTDSTTDTSVRVDAKVAEQFEKEAVCFYRPLPQKELRIPDLLGFMKKCITMSDVIFIIILAVLIPMLGMMLPRITKALTGPIVSKGDSSILLPVSFCLAGF